MNDHIPAAEPKAIADNELERSTPSENERHDALDAFAYALSRALKIPPEILDGRSKTDTKNKGESKSE